MATPTEEEDDYLSMTFTESSTSTKETSLQRKARLKKEAAERSRPKSKAEQAAAAARARDIALATSIATPSNRGAAMMAKMGFTGGTLGQTEGARTRPIELLMKDDRGGIGMDSGKKRRVREAAEMVEEGRKRQKVDVEEFRDRNRMEVEERRTEGLMWGAMKTLQGLEEEKDEGEESNEDGKKANTKRRRLRDANVLYRPLLKRRLENERDRKMRYELNNSLSTRDNADSDDDDAKVGIFDDRTEDLEDIDSELDAFEALTPAKRLEKITEELRQKHHYCFWCKFQYPSAEMDGCPGMTEDEHG